jgi:hypothetical protein
LISTGAAIDPWPRVSATASGIKWALIVLFVIYAVIALSHAIAAYFGKH